MASGGARRSLRRARPRSAPRAQVVRAMAGTWPPVAGSSARIARTSAYPSSLSENVMSLTSTSGGSRRKSSNASRTDVAVVTRAPKPVRPMTYISFESTSSSTRRTWTSSSITGPCDLSRAGAFDSLGPVLRAGFGGTRVTAVTLPHPSACFNPDECFGPLRCATTTVRTIGAVTDGPPQPVQCRSGVARFGRPAQPKYSPSAG
jgi:hypothetical protein